MRPYPLIPEAGTYGVAILIILSLSAFSLASHIHFRLQQPGIPFLAVYCPVLSLIAFWGAVVLDPALWFDGGIRGWLFAVSTGPLLGVTAAWADRRIIRPIERKRALSWRARFKPVPSDVWNSFGSVRIYGDSKRRRVPLRKMQHPGAGSGIGAHNLSLTVVILAGALEEILYRGVLVQLCFLLPSTILIAAALCA